PVANDRRPRRPPGGDAGPQLAGPARRATPAARGAEHLHRRVNATERRIVLADDARRLRRLLGATAWAALEDLLTDAASADDELTACSNVRRVAAQVGVSKDTAARAISRLIRAGIVERGHMRSEV